MQVSLIRYPLNIVVLLLISSCYLEVDARPAQDRLLRSGDYKVDGISRKNVQAENKAAEFSNNQRETVIEDSSTKFAREVKEASLLTRNRRENEIKDVSNQNEEAGRELGKSRKEETGADGEFTRRRFTRSDILENDCIKRFEYRIIYNHLFAIPVCKRHKGCIEVAKIVNFGRGRTLAINFNCTMLRNWES